MPNAMTAMLLHFEDDTPEAEGLARAAGLTPTLVTRDRSAEGELRFQLPHALPERVVVYRSLHRPDEKLIDLLLLARTASRLGAARLVLVTPCLAGRRADAEEGEGARIVGAFLAGLFDGVVTVDPHLYGAADFADAVPARHAIVVSAVPLLAELAAARRPRPLLLAMDGAGMPWVQRAAARHGFDQANCVGAADGEVGPPADLDLNGRAVVIVGEVACSVDALARLAQRLRHAGARSVDVAVTHAVFAHDALQALRAAGIDEVWSSDSVPHPSNAVSVAPLIAQALYSIGCV